MSKNRMSLFNSAISLLLCVSMLLGTTWAWFTDSVTSTANVISTGTLRVELYHTSNAYPTPTEVTETTKDLFKVELWEPGVATYENFTIKSVGSLWLKYQLGLKPLDVNYVVEGGFRLSQALKAGVVPGGVKDSNNDGTITREEAIGQVTGWTSLDMVLQTGYLAPQGESAMVEGSLVEDQEDYGVVIWWEPTGNDNNWNVNNGKTTSDGNPLTIDLGVALAATQMANELDSFGPDYDSTAQFPKLNLPVNVTVNVANENDATAQAVTMLARDITATVPAGVQLEAGTQALTLSVTELEQSQSNITTNDAEDTVSLDVHIQGVAETNTTPIIVDLGPVMPRYLNMGNYRLYHVEDGTTNPMTMVASLAQLDGHNEFYYDMNTGNLTVAMATFSEVMVVADTENAWEGEFDYTWYDAEAEVLTIANADQLAGLSAIVGGMDGQTQDSFVGKTVNLVANINIGDLDSENDMVFYPIGYYNSTKSYEKTSGGSVTSSVSSFEGTFDGQGHTIANFYQNTWEMFGDYNDGYSGTPNHYKDAMGLFGYVLNGTVKNLTVDNFSSDGEFTPTGVIAAYACNSTFENIAITNCNPRVYNTGNGGIVGIGGNSDDGEDLKLTFKNITIDNTNKITALWGSWDVACGGLVGMFRGAGHVYMNNCHVAAQMDVFNDVCGNYQYYWYRYAGMMVGTNKNMVTDANGYTVPETSKYHAEDCTVHFGSWNDYYYCELVANSLASYTHDHQFSRLEQVDSVDVVNKTITVGGVTTDIPGGRCNYVVVKDTGGTENAECYHFVDRVQWNHEDAGVETVNGETVLKENNQHIYLPFNQLFTGYGWGVKHIPVHNGENYAFAGIEILDRQIADSEVKFQAKVEPDSYVLVGGAVPLGNLFQAIDGKTINSSGVVATIDKVNEEDDVSGVFVPNADDWTKSTITFYGKGEGNVVVTIQDYEYCTQTTLELTVGNDRTRHLTDHMHLGWLPLYETAMAAKPGQNEPEEGAKRKLILLSGNYYLEEDVNPYGTIYIMGDVHICLNGHTMTCDLENENGQLTTYGNELDGVSPDSETINLTVCDCSDDKTGAIAFDTTVEKGGAHAIKVSDHTLPTTVTIEAGTFSNFRGSAIYNDSHKEGSSLTIKDGTFTGNGTIGTTYGGGIYSRAPVTITGGTITGNTAIRGGGVYVNSADFTMSGGTISDNKATGGVRTAADTGTTDGAEDETDTVIAAFGGGLYTAHGDVTITGGSFTGNNAAYDSVNNGFTSRSCGGAIFITGTSADGVRSSIKDTEIKFNIADYGSAIRYQIGTHTLEDCQIRYNGAREYAAICVGLGDADLTLTGENVLYGNLATVLTASIIVHGSSGLEASLIIRDDGNGNSDYFNIVHTNYQVTDKATLESTVAEMKAAGETDAITPMLKNLTVLLPSVYVAHDLRDAATETPTSHAVEIYSGRFNHFGQSKAVVAAACYKTVVYGGHFTADPSAFVAAGYVAQKTNNQNYPWKVVAETG